MHATSSYLWHSQCMLWQVCVLVEGLYQLEVTVFGYDNPTGRCQCDGSPRCCDNSGTTNCGRRCDSYFRYCLRTIESTERGCSYFDSRMSARNNNDGSLDFSRSTVLNLENPIILRGLTDTYMVMLLMHDIVDLILSSLEKSCAYSSLKFILLLASMLQCFNLYFRESSSILRY